MNQKAAFHIVTVGWDRNLIEGVCDRIAAKSTHSFSHILHPMLDRDAWGKGAARNDITFIRDDIRMAMPLADPEFLASLEQEGVPTIHNMIMSDRVVSKLPYDQALAYASFLAKRLVTLYQQTEPSVVIGGFDALHGSVAFAVARKLKISWFAMNFSVLPPGMASFCDHLSYASSVTLGPRSKDQLRVLAEKVLKDFESNRIKAYAYIPPALLSPALLIRRIPSQIKSLVNTIKRRRLGRYIKYTDYRSYYSVAAMLGESIQYRRNLFQLPRRWLLKEPPAGRYVFFGLHLQPESSIDVGAHFYSDQLRVVEMIARSIPPTHKLLVKLHKSGVAQYSPDQLAQFTKLPGVQLVSPFANTRAFIQQAALIFSIQGTIGLEAALLGKPVVMFGDSPVGIFPSASGIGKLSDLPHLVRKKLVEQAPHRTEILDALVRYLAPFHPATLNDWTVMPSEQEIDSYIKLFGALRQYLQAGCGTPNPEIDVLADVSS